MSIEEKPKEASKEQPVVTLEKQGTPVEIEAVKPVDMGGDEPKEQVAASESERGKAILEQLVGQELPSAEESPEVTTQALLVGSRSCGHSYFSGSIRFSFLFLFKGKEPHCL